MIEDLRSDGYVMGFCDPQIALSLRATIVPSRSYTGHVITQGDRVARSYSDALRQPHGFVCHEMKTVLSAPGLFDAIAQYHMLAAEYFGEEPLLYSVNAFWKKPKGAPGWHHDTDDGPKQLVMFMYGTEVSEETGGVHAYVTGSHLWDRAKLKPWHNVQEDVSGPLPSEWPVHNIYGKAGTAFLTDTLGLHNGLAPFQMPRLLLWARWCAGGPPQSYVNDEIKPVRWNEIVKEKPSEEIQRRTRLVVDWE